MKKYRIAVASSMRLFLVDAVETLANSSFVEEVFYFESGSSLMEYFAVERNIDFLILDYHLNESLYKIIDRLSLIVNLKIIVMSENNKGVDSFLSFQGAAIVVPRPNKALEIKRLLYNYLIHMESEALSSVSLQQLVVSKLDKQVISVLLDYEFKVSVKGYNYLRYALVYLLSELNDQQKHLYKKIACHYETTYSRVERAIRHAITIAYNRYRQNAGNKKLSSLFRRGKLSNYEFILKIAEIIKTKQA